MVKRSNPLFLKNPRVRFWLRHFVAERVLRSSALLMGANQIKYEQITDGNDVNPAVAAAGFTAEDIASVGGERELAHA